MIYEEDFLECSFGFRPGRSCHDALRLLGGMVNRDDIHYVVDTDIKSFFDKWLNRRSQKKSFSWNKFKIFLRKYNIVRPTIKVNLYKLGAGASYLSE